MADFFATFFRKNFPVIGGMIVTLAAVFALSGCAALMVKPFLDPLAGSLERQTDLALVREGTPSFLLMIDGLIGANPHDRRLLMSGVQAYIFFAAVQFEYGEESCAVELSKKARDYGKALLLQIADCGQELPRTLADFTSCIRKIGKQDVAPLFWGGYGWATWINYQEGSPAAVADLPKVEQLMLRILALDESFYHGAAHLFLGAYYAARPPMFGGKPEESRRHFERALAISSRHFLLTQVLYAKTYARMTANRALFEKLLREVIDQPLIVDDLASSNKLAKMKAGRLLAHINEFF